MYNRIIEEKLVTPSLAEVVFGTGRKRMGRLLSSMLPKTLHEICMVYSSLVQAYVIGVAQQRGVKITELKEYEAVADTIFKLWTEGRSIEDKKIYSFINLCACNDELVKKDFISRIGDWGNAYNDIMDSGVNKIDFYLEEEDFIEFLRALPLLSQTTVDTEKNKLIIDNGKYLIKCDYFPYIAFCEYNPNCERDFISRKVTEDCYVLNSVSRGQRDGELQFHYTKINSANKNALQIKETGKVYENENLILICRALGLKTEWYEASYWCDFAFIKRVADIVNDSLLKTLGLDSPQRSNSDVRDKLKPLFAGTVLEGIVPEKKDLAENTKEELKKNLFYPSKVKSFIYELFIMQGIFKSIYCMMLPVEKTFSNENSEKLFNEIMLGFERAGLISKQECDSKIALCNEQIKNHIFKLAKIVQKNTRAYRLRENEIRAEQRTICILHTAGIKNDKIVADAEDLLSIDDFYDMFNNPETSINEDLSSLLELLCCFYGALLENRKEFDSEKYYKDVYKLRKEKYNSQRSFEELFNAFIDIVKRSKNNEVIDKLIGRDCICDLEQLEGFEKDILKLKEENDYIFSKITNANGKNAPGMFISYAHDDNPDNNPQIRNFADYFLNETVNGENINVFFDGYNLEPSDNWMEEARDFICDKNTQMVVFFVSRTSVLSRQIKFEIDLAIKEAQRRFGGNSKEDKKRRESFIMLVNLEQETIKSFLNDMLMDPKYSQNELELISDYLQTISSPFFVKIDDREEVLRKFRDNVLKNGNFISDMEESFSDDANDEVRLQIKNFLSFLKYGNNYDWKEGDELDAYFNSEENDTSFCIFPMIASVRETRIKRDNITVIGYEIINGKGRANKTSNYILSSKKLAVEEYYCVPNYKTVGKNCSWMIEPLLISHDKFIKNEEE